MQLNFFKYLFSVFNYRNQGCFVSPKLAKATKMYYNMLVTWEKAQKFTTKLRIEPNNSRWLGDYSVTEIPEVLSCIIIINFELL